MKRSGSRKKTPGLGFYFLPRGHPAFTTGKQRPFLNLFFLNRFFSFFRHGNRISLFCSVLRASRIRCQPPIGDTPPGGGPCRGSRHSQKAAVHSRSGDTAESRSSGENGTRRRNSSRYPGRGRRGAVLMSKIYSRLGSDCLASFASTCPTSRSAVSGRPCGGHCRALHHFAPSFHNRL